VAVLAWFIFFSFGLPKAFRLLSVAWNILLVLLPLHITTEVHNLLMAKYPLVLDPSAGFSAVFCQPKIFRYLNTISNMLCWNCHKWHH